MACQHKTIRARVETGRVTEDGTENSALIAVGVDLGFQCGDCGLPFRWVGATHADATIVSRDGLTITLACEPAYVVLAASADLSTMTAVGEG